MTTTVPVAAERARDGVTDTVAVCVALAAIVGARLPVPAHIGPVVLGGDVVLAVVAFVLRRPWILVLAVALSASALAARAETGLGGVPDTYRGEVEVIDVSENPYLGTVVKVRAGSHQLEVVPPENARDLAGAARRGDRLVVSGTVKPVDPDRARRRGSHVAGRLRATRLEPGAPGGPLWRLVGGIRGGVTALGGALPASQRGLFTGFVLGDASGQSDLQRADFRASGLTHLFVASGEHVAFVLLLFAPLSRRVGMRSRWTLTVALCVLYALVTGLQPSVLRAATMAVVATTAAGLGRPIRSWRSLAFAVTLLVLADPFLVYSVAFGLSVGACVGIVALARRLVDVLWGPLWLRRPLAVTIAAQIGVAPLLVGFPGGMPVAAIPANVLAVPPAGGIMVLGLPALMLAATHLPGTALLVWIPRLLLAWLDGVARVTAALPLGRFGAATVGAAVAGTGMVLVADRFGATGLRRIGAMVVGGALCAAVFVGSPGPGGGDGPVVVRRGATTVVVLTGSVPTDALLTELAVRRVGVVDLLVVPTGDRGDVDMLETIEHRHEVRRVLTPTRVAGIDTPQTVVDTGDRLRVGDATLRVVSSRAVLSVHVEER